MAESKYFPNLGNGVDIADVEQVEAAFSAVQADMEKKIEGVADNAITTDKIADGAVTTDKIADGSVTANKLNGIVESRLFTGYITDTVVGETVDYNTLTNLSQTTGSGIYHHTVTQGTETNTAIVIVESADVFDDTDTDCKQMLIKSDGKMYVRTHTQASGWTTFKNTVPIDTLGADGKILDYYLHNPIKNLTDGTAPNSLQTPNSQAISEGAVALGKNSTAGSKCFNITAFDDANKSYTLDSVEGLEVGDVFSLKMVNNYDNNGSITAINGNVVTVDNYQPLDANAEVKYFRVNEKPTCGTTDFGIGAFAGGEGSMTQGDGGFSWGRNCKSFGRYGVSFGRDSEAAYAAFGGGRNTHALANYSFGYGLNGIIRKIAERSIILGRGLIAGSKDQFVIGEHNIEDVDNLYSFIVGNGIGERFRSNSLTLTKQGKLWLASDVENGTGDKLSEKENKGNKVTSISDESTDEQYPSAKAVNDVVKQTNDIVAENESFVRRNVSNSIKGVFRNVRYAEMTDVSPIEHDLSVKVNTQGDPRNVKLYSYWDNYLPYPYRNTTKTVNGVTFTDNGDGSITINGTANEGQALFTCYINTNGLSPMAQNGISLKLSVKSDKSWGDNTIFALCNYYDESGTMRNAHCEVNYSNTSATTTTTNDWHGMIVMIGVRSGKTVNNITIQPKLMYYYDEILDDTDNYTPLTTYTPNADGTVSGVKSVYPVMKLELSDTTADMTVEYNRDINKVIAEKSDKDDVQNRLFDGTITIANESIDDSAELKNATEIGVYRVLLDDDVAQDSGILINHQKTLSQYSQTLILDGKTYYRTGVYSSGNVVWTEFETTEKIKEYGVRWAGTSSTSCERLGDSVGLVANAYKGSTDTTVVNDFDNIYPWSGMKRCNVNESGDILAYEGDPNFKLDGTNGDVMVEIPKFYYKRTKAGTVEEWWICGIKLPGYELHPLFIDNGKEVSKVFHSVYNASSFTDETDNKVKLQSITGVQPRVRTTRANFRTYARNKGAIWGIEDISCVNALQLLYLVEYANTHSQSALGSGADYLSYTANHKALEETTNGNTITIASTYKNTYNLGQRIEIGTSQGVNNKTSTPRTITAITTDEETGQTTITFDGDPITIAVGNMMWNVAPLNGSCDALNGKSGWLAGENNYTDHHADVNYRGIEGFHAKLFRFIDGVNIKDRVVYYANSITEYADGVYDGKYRAVGYSNAEASGYVSAFGYDEKAPWVMFPSAAAGGSSTFVPDYYYQGTGGRLLLLGGFWGHGSGAGAFCFSCGAAFSGSNLNFGSHLLVKKP